MIYSDVIGRSDMTFQLFAGGRGVGKTYSALKYLAKRSTESKFMYMRRTDSEIERSITKYTNPFKVVNYNENLDIDAQYFSKERYGIFYEHTVENGEETPKVIGYAVSLSTFAKMRGLDFSDVDVIVFDEIIPEKHVHKINGEGEAFMHMYETVNRNREFDGREPVRVYMLCNAISLNNDILLELGIVSEIAKMLAEGRNRRTIKEKGIYIELINNDAFRKMKEKTALYKMAGKGDFSRQALDNEFTDVSFRDVKKVNLNEYKPMFSFGEYTVFIHKNNGSMYICRKKMAGVIRYEESDRDIIYWRFAPRYRQLVLSRLVTYDDYVTKMVFDALTSRK